MTVVHDDLPLEGSEDFYYFIEFDIATETASEGLETLIEAFEPVRKRGYFLHSPLVAREYRRAGACQLVIGRDLLEPHTEEYRLYLYPRRGLVSMQSSQQLTDHPESLRYLLPQGQRWISPTKLTEFTLETCRFAFQKLLTPEANALGLRWRTGFLPPDDRDRDVWLPRARLQYLAAFPRERLKTVPLAAFEPSWTRSRRLTPEGNAFDILRVIYEQCGLRPQEIPFCDGDQISVQEIRSLGSVQANPFRGYTMPVMAKDFFAHRNIVKRLTQQAMAGGGAYVVQGARRTGKSSVLLEAQRNLEAYENVLVVRFDLMEADRDLTRLFKRIVQHIPDALRRKRKSGFDTARILSEDSKTETALLTDVVEELQNLKIDNPVIVVMLDEWGHLLGIAEGLQIDPEILRQLGEFYGQLRSSLEVLKEHYRFVFAGLPWHFKNSFVATKTGLQSYIYKWFSVPFVDDGVIDAMIGDKLSHESLTIRDLALERCLELASGQMHDANLLMYWAIEDLFSEKKSGSELKKKHFKTAEKRLVDHYRQFRIALWETLDNAAKDWLVHEAQKDKAAWESGHLTKRNSPVDLEAFFGMGYSTYSRDSGEEVIAIPMGLKMSIARLAKNA